MKVANSRRVLLDRLLRFYLMLFCSKKVFLVHLFTSVKSEKSMVSWSHFASSSLVSIFFMREGGRKCPYPFLTFVLFTFVKSYIIVVFLRKVCFFLKLVNYKPFFFWVQARDPGLVYK